VVMVSTFSFCCCCEGVCVGGGGGGGGGGRKEGRETVTSYDRLVGEKGEQALLWLSFVVFFVQLCSSPTSIN